MYIERPTQYPVNIRTQFTELDECRNELSLRPLTNHEYEDRKGEVSADLPCNISVCERVDHVQVGFILYIFGTQYNVDTYNYAYRIEDFVADVGGYLVRLEIS